MARLNIIAETAATAKTSTQYTPTFFHIRGRSCDVCTHTDTSSDNIDKILA